MSKYLNYFRVNARIQRKDTLKYNLLITTCCLIDQMINAICENNIFVKTFPIILATRQVHQDFKLLTLFCLIS